MSFFFSSKNSVMLFYVITRTIMFSFPRSNVKNPKFTIWVSDQQNESSSNL